MPIKPSEEKHLPWPVFASGLTLRWTETLDKFIAQRHGPGTRGRSVPSTGQERLYKAQRIHAGGPFLRLPLAPLGTDKGGFVRVRFERDQITVKNV